MFGALFHSYLLAQIFGLYMIITAIILLSKVSFYREMIQNLQANNVSIVCSASFGLMLGLFLILVHNIWVWEPRVVITIISWFILIKSVLWLAMPESLLHWSKKVYAGPGYYVAVVILFVVGFFLLTKGFYFYIPDSHVPFD
ncbi:hypothetical protein [Legionella nagasakiensis]|uniref:hypothetical protein n=1 Tax=Legionella nagasakiensis TaxID=535290 RepID=UPI001054F430|nr:hypothetical protein [Legionella nagasakiensis]